MNIQSITLILVAACIHVNASFIDFDKGMSSEVKYVAFKNNSDWRILREAYEKIIARLEYSQKPTIPKIIHHIWLGSPLPEKYQKLRQRWIELHPTWQHILWTEAEINDLNLINKNAFNRALTYGEKSDIARYEILNRFGGLYVDTDFECIKSLDEFHHTLFFYAGVLHPEKVEINNALIASAPNNPVLQFCIKKIAEDRRSTDRNPMSILDRTGPFLFTRCVFESGILNTPTNKALIFPANYFYPLPSYNREKPDHFKWIKDETYALHHFDCSWAK